MTISQQCMKRICFKFKVFVGEMWIRPKFLTIAQCPSNRSFRNPYFGGDWDSDHYLQMLLESVDFGVDFKGYFY